MGGAAAGRRRGAAVHHDATASTRATDMQAVGDGGNALHIRQAPGAGDHKIRGRPHPCILPPSSFWASSSAGWPSPAARLASKGDYSHSWSIKWSSPRMPVALAELPRRTSPATRWWQRPASATSRGSLIAGAEKKGGIHYLKVKFRTQK